MALDKGSQKVIVTIVLAMFLAVISLITALPPMRNFEIDSSQTIDSSATALMAFSTIIGFFLVPAFAFTLGNFHFYISLKPFHFFTIFINR